MTAKEYNDGVNLWTDDVMRFAVRCGGVYADCQDAVQDALASLWNHRDNITVEKGKSYLLSVAYRRLMSRFRHLQVEREHAPSLTIDQLQPPDERFDMREAIEKALQHLPEVQRAILQLRDVEGYSYAEIGETLGLDGDRVQVYLFRARVTMRKQLIKMGYGNNQ